MTPNADGHLLVADDLARVAQIFVPGPMAAERPKQPSSCSF